MTLGLALAAPAFSGDDGLALTASKHQDGPFGNSNPRFNIDPGDTKNAWFKVKNRTNDKVKNIRLQEIDKTKNVTIQMFHGDENITQEAGSMDRYKFTLDAGDATKFKARLKVNGQDKGLACMLVGVDKQNVGTDEAFASVNTDC